MNYQGYLWNGNFYNLRYLITFDKRNRYMITDSSNTWKTLTLEIQIRGRLKYICDAPTDTRRSRNIRYS